MPRQSLKKPTASFQKRVYDAVRRIPQGKTISYRQIADLISAPKAFRAVGNALNRNPDLKNIPCHRVVRSDGSVGGYTKGQKEKIRILEKEGVLIKNKKVLF
jgi:O-6-methylguanine DNA methyltransferase